MPNDILDNLLRLDPEERVRFSLLWNPSDPHFLVVPIGERGCFTYVTRAIRWPMNELGRLDQTAVMNKGGKPVWLAFSGDRLEGVRAIHNEWPFDQHDLRIKCYDSYFQRWSEAPCKTNVLTMLLQSNKDHPVVLASKALAAEPMRPHTFALSTLRPPTHYRLREWAEEAVETTRVFEQLRGDPASHLPEMEPRDEVTWMDDIIILMNQMRGDRDHPAWTGYDGRIGEPRVYEHEGHHLVIVPDDRSYYAFADAPLEHFVDRGSKIAPGE
jgi:hypothetical protein